LAPGFAARHDTRTPVRCGIYALLAHLALSIALVFPLAHAGLALATSLAAFVNAGLLLIKLVKEGIYRPSKTWLSLAPRLLFANAAIATALVCGVDAAQWTHWAAKQRMLHLGLWIAVAMLVYALALLLCGFKMRTIADKSHSL
jgi:putative peptidoglycan lipid II flippase